MTKYTKPILKWVGGKTQIIDQVINLFPKTIENYHEPFLGGGSVLLALLENVKNKKITVKGRIYAYDINQTLINMYKNIQSNPDELFNLLSDLIEVYNNITTKNGIRKAINLEEAKTSQESYYYWIRLLFNKMTQEDKNSTLGSAYFIFMNKTCFRGVYREGPNGFNVPFGNYIKPEIINFDHLKEVSQLIQNVVFRYSSFEESLTNVMDGDFTYLDPPYAPENDKSFTSYTALGFKKEQHQLLFNLSKKIMFLMSNADVEMVKKEYTDAKYTIQSISCKRSINSKNPEAKTNEVLIKSY